MGLRPTPRNRRGLAQSFEGQKISTSIIGLRMRNLSIRDLIDLVASEADTPETRIEKIFEWEHSRRLEAVKWILTAAAAFFAPFLIAHLKGEISKTASNIWVFAALFGSVLFAFLGLIKLYRIRYIHRSYVSALVLLADLKRIAPLIRRYRSLRS